MVLNNLLNSSMHAWDSKPDFQSSFSFSFNSFSMCRCYLTRFMVHKNLYIICLSTNSFVTIDGNPRDNAAWAFLSFFSKILWFLSWQKSLFPKGTTLLIMMLCCTRWFRLTDDYKSKKKIFWGGHKNLDHLPFLIWQKFYLSVSNYKWKMGHFFMIFSEYLNFTWICNTVYVYFM